ncbi:heme exporter protein CcmD [Variovorax rhizosphaerae]|uniref:Heme exporter protein D n=1 Tax=Variovorax rhizosphaerae TaxID=1836200 RepID=A0ABU8WEJ3_9BURK
MTGTDHTFYIVAAYGVTLVLLAAEVWTLVRRSRAQARREDDARRAR